MDYRRSILVADDDASSRETIGEALSRRGYRVETARDGLEAVDVARRKRVDLGIIDYSMPRMDGLDTMRTLRRLGRPIPIIMVTSESTGILEEAAGEEGARAFLPKPVDLRDLTRIVLEIFDSRLPMVASERWELTRWLDDSGGWTETWRYERRPREE